MNRNILLLQVGSQLRKRRVRLRLTLADVSRRSGVTIAQLSRIENGLVDPRLSTLVRILDALGARPKDISVASPRTVSIDEVLERREQGRRSIERAGLEPSDGAARLDRKDRRGIRTASERAMLGTRE